MRDFVITNGRPFTKIEQQMIWRKPQSHQTSQEEIRIAGEIKENWLDTELKISNILLEGDAGSGKTQLAKALSADLQLPYTKITCFADMDKSDVFGALLPIVESDREEDQELLESIYQTESLETVLELIGRHYSIDAFNAKQKLVAFINRIEAGDTSSVQYKYYPSEIVRAIEKGYLLEIQEPTVIRDASVLVALNSALESDGMLNLPTGMVQRHPDCVIVITTNRNYQGNRPLNESLRDRMQHAEKMDLPPLSVMVERGIAKSGINQEELLEKMAEIVRLLDLTAKNNAIKGVAGMRSYFYWINTYKNQEDLFATIYQKVLYKLTTDENELKILEDALAESQLLFELRGIINQQPRQKAGRKISQTDAKERNIFEDSLTANLVAPADELSTVEEKTAETEEVQKQEETPKTNIAEPSSRTNEELATDELERQASLEHSESGEFTEKTEAGLGEGALTTFNEAQSTEKKELNKAAREFLKQTIHNKSGLIIHRPTMDAELLKAAQTAKQPLLKTVDQLSRQMLAILEKEQPANYQTGKYEGSRFNASRVAYGDFKNFDRQNPPTEGPSLALALRIDESGSMIRDQRLESARAAALAVNEFAKEVNIPLLIYGDTADKNMREKTSVYSYKEFADSFQFVDGKLMTMTPRQNNRDGVVLRLIADKLVQQTATTKLLINISDGQPKALPDYSGQKAQADIQQVLNDYERQGIIFLAAAIGQDKEIIKNIYGEQRFLDISDLQTLPMQLIELISRYL
ncbi:AAA family ATPase [Enterococcus sp. LJL90]